MKYTEKYFQLEFTLLNLQQGDTLASLWFLPVSNTLRKHVHKVQHNVNNTNVTQTNIIASTACIKQNKRVGQDSRK